MSEVTNTKDHRVKVYQLNEDGQWDDKGTGHVCLTPVAEGQTIEMCVRCEESDADLLEHKVMSDIDYARQGDTIITWCQPDGTDLALSFQEALGCTEVWNKILCIIGQRDDHDMTGPLQVEEVESISLPDPTLQNIPAILKIVSGIPANQRDALSTALLQGDYLKNLLDVFQQVEDFEKADIATLFFDLFKHIVLLNEILVFEVIFSDDLFDSMVAVFDYDPALTSRNRREHRDFLAKAKFKQVMDIKDQGLLKKIHQNYRMTYFKDVVLLRYIDDGTLSTLSSMIYYNNVNIILHITEFPKLVKTLFSKIQTAVSSIQAYESKESKVPPPDNVAKDPFLFLQELCNIVKPLQVPIRDAFYKTLVDAEVFSTIEDALVASSPNRQPWVWQACVDILYNMLVHDSAMLRFFLVSRIPSKKSLLARIVAMVVSEQVTEGLVYQLGEILRMVMDPDSMQTSDKDLFLDHFYSAHVVNFDIALTTQPKTTDGMLVKYNALEMFSMCAKQHGYRAKQFVLGHGVLQKAVKLVALGDRHLILSAIRLLRTCLGTKDPAYSRYVVQHKLLDPIIDLFVSNGARYNILNSNVIELVDLIHRENIKSLISYLMQNHGKKFKTVDYVDTFRMMAVQHENNSQDGSMDTKDEKMQNVNDDGEDSKCEYNYFEKDDGEEDSAPLMDLDLEDENDGFIARKSVEEDKEDDLMSMISKRQSSKPKKLSGKGKMGRKNPLEIVVDAADGTESPRKKRRMEDVK